tara:strand:+ start:34 stop:450 length:417 start_codon:yes stop_codon:yes gene_type:complete
MENDKSTITRELDHIRNSINQKDETQSDDDDFILLDKIVSKSKKYDKNSKIEDKPKSKDIQDKNKISKTDSKLSNPKKNIVNNISKPLKKTKDPVEALVDREIKPIIKKWISKNLKSFVKTIVIEEMKLISKATQKHK